MPDYRLAIVGYGKMGKLIEKSRAGVRLHSGLQLVDRQREVVTRRISQGLDVAIDFSIPSAVAGNVETYRRARREHGGRHHRLARTHRRVKPPSSATASAWSGARIFPSA